VRLISLMPFRNDFAQLITACTVAPPFSCYDV
jgi:hypothetical protein